MTISADSGPRALTEGCLLGWGTGRAPAPCLKQRATPQQHLLAMPSSTPGTGPQPASAVAAATGRQARSSSRGCWTPSQQRRASTVQFWRSRPPSQRLAAGQAAWTLPGMLATLPQRGWCAGRQAAGRTGCSVSACRLVVNAGSRRAASVATARTAVAAKRRLCADRSPAASVAVNNPVVAPCLSLQHSRQPLRQP